ncbi:MAG: molybdopterin dinucleotide binding domain-containing protein, partial [Acidobacteriota bacterium]|nr:molybdopterin dinucleotide binding domain-containing protein [Acidobacteriota bacterium]
LPARTRYEQEGGGTQTSTERRVIFSPEIDRSVGEAKSEWRIFLELAHAVDAERAGLLGCTDSQAIREEIAHVVPAYDGIQHFSGTGDAIQYGGPHLCDKWEFPTPDGQAHFVVVQLPFSDKREGWFKISTRRGRQFNSMIYGEVDPINNAARDSILMNPEDAGDLQFSQHQKVKLISKTGVFEGRILFAPIARGNLQVHFPEGNVLIPRGIVDADGGVPDYNTEVRVETAPSQRFG